MSDLTRFSIPMDIAAVSAAFAAPRAKSAAVPNTVYVALGASSKSANISRDNYFIPSFEINKDIIDDIIIGPVVRNKVVTQSIAPGTVVAKGTAVSIVVSPAQSLPGGILNNGHVFLKDVTMESAYNDFVRDNGVLRRVLERNPDASKISSADRAIVEQAATGATFSDQPGNTVEDMVRSLHLAKTMVE